MARDLKFRIGHRTIHVSKVRVVTIAILLTACLLVYTTELLRDSAFRMRGEMDVQPTTTIDQNMTYTVDRVPYASANSFIVLNTSETNELGSINGYLPRFDYDRIVFNMTVKPRDGFTVVTFMVWLETGVQQTIWSINETTTISLELNVYELQYSSATWLFSYTAEVVPLEDVIIQNLVVWVYSDVPLVPVSIDLQTTDGFSIFDNPLTRSFSYVYPYLDLSKDNNSRHSDSLIPQVTNYTLFLRPGSLNGTAKWYDWNGAFDSVPLNITYSLNEKVTVDIRMFFVRIDLDVDMPSPITEIVIFGTPSYHTIYDLYVTSDMFPLFLYAPPISSFQISVGLSNMEYYGEQYLSSSYYAYARINLNDTHNLSVDVKFENVTFLGIAATSDIILGALSIILFLLVLFRIGLAFHIPERKVPRDFRLVPLILYSALAIIPWFSSTRLFSPWTHVTNIAIHSLAMGPLPIVGFWVDGSSIVWSIPPEALYWSLASILLYWAPVLWSAFSIDMPRDLENDTWAGLFLFLPLLLVSYVYLGLDDITGELVTVLFPVILLILIPVAWLCAVWYRARTPTIGEANTSTSTE
jgi:hypothetical protein